MASHYPEAVPLKDHKAPTVCRALAEIFCRTGFPKEIQSDQGTEFLSNITQAFVKDYGIKHVKASPFHPQTQGMIERYHRSMKNMIRALVEEQDKDWDELLPFVMFSYRECPHESLGFSPFELIYTYRARGPLQLMKDKWTERDEELRLSKSKPDKQVVSFMMEVRDRVMRARKLAVNNAIQAKVKSKKWYDKRARFRTFQVGQKVLIFLPKAGEPLKLAWHGPYKVVERMGSVDYKVETDSKRKRFRVCHVNMMKAYVESTQYRIQPISCCTEGEQDKDLNTKSSNAIPEANEFCFGELDADKKEELKALLSKFADLFTDDPRFTTIEEHKIVLKEVSTI
jgi:hypothetical protein